MFLFCVIIIILFLFFFITPCDGVGNQNLNIKLQCFLLAEYYQGTLYQHRSCMIDTCKINASSLSQVQAAAWKKHSQVLNHTLEFCYVVGIGKTELKKQIRSIACRNE